MIRGNLLAVLAGALVATSAGAQTGPRKTTGTETEKLEAAADNIARMKTSLKQVLGRAEQARNEKDVVKLNCVNEKLTQIKALIKVAEQADLALHESVAAKDTGGEAEFSKIAIARTKIDRLRADSENCVGQLAFMVDEKTTVEVEAPQGLPGRPSGGLGLASRADTNPGDVAADLGFAAGTDAPSRTAAPYVPPTIVRPPAASPYR